MTRVLAPGRLRRTILLIVMAAWLLSQALGLVHRVVHPAPAGHANPAHADATHVHAAHGPFASHPVSPVPVAHEHRDEGHDHTSGGGHGLEHLFGSHGPGAGACVLYDQLAHADLLWSPPADSCSVAVTDAARSDRPAWHLAAQAAGYLARGPPPSA